MPKRTITIIIAAIGGLALLCALVLGGALLTFSILHVRPAQALAAVQPQVDPQTGVLVSAVAEDSPAAHAGIVRGDILLEFNGVTLETVQDLMQEIVDLKPGDSVEVRVLHGDEQRDLQVTLGDQEGRAYLGLTPCGPDFGLRLRQMDAAPGALIVEVVADGPADQAGLQEGDRILSVNGNELNNDNTLRDVIAGYQPNDNISLEIARSGETDPITLEVTLGEHPEEADRAYLGVRYSEGVPRIAPDGEMPFIQPFEGHPEVPDMPFDFRRGDEFPDLPDEFQGGVLIGEVAQDSPAEQAGLQRGWIIVEVEGESIVRPGALVETIGNASPGDNIVLTVYDPESEQTSEITVTLGENPNEDGKAYLGIQIQGIMMRQERQQNQDDEDSSSFFDRLPFENLPFWDRNFEFDFQLPQNVIPEGEAL